MPQPRPWKPGPSREQSLTEDAVMPKVRDNGPVASPNKVLQDASTVAPSRVDIDSITQCLERLSDAEAVLATVRSALGEVCSRFDRGPEDPTSPADDGLVENETPQDGLAENKDKLDLTAEDSALGLGKLLEQEGKMGAQALVSADPLVATVCTELAEKLGLSEAKVQSIFEIFSHANHSRTGAMTLEELEALLVSMCDGTIERSQLEFIMQKFDKDCDGLLHFGEFIVAFVHSPLMKVAHLQDELKTKGANARNAVQDKLSADDWVEITGCRAISVKRYVSSEIEEAGSCLAMPWVFAMFLLFVVSVFFHLDFEQTHAVDQAIFFDITENANFAFGGEYPFQNGRMGHKNIFDVNSFADFWSWLDLGIVPIYWAEGWDLSETRTNVQMACANVSASLEYFGFPPPTLAQGQRVGTGPKCPADNYPKRPAPFYANADGGTYLYYNSVLGGVRLRQERTEAEACPNDDDSLLSSLHKGLCVPEVGYFLRPELHTALRPQKHLMNRPGGETVYLPALAPQSLIRSTLRKLENRVWLSPHTAKIEVLFTTYNAHLDIFSATSIWVFMNRGGHMFKVVEPISTFLTTYRLPGCYVVDVLLTLLFLKIVIEEGIDIRSACKDNGVKEGLKVYISPANFVDWVGVFYFVFLVIYWVKHIHLIAQMRDAMRNASVTVTGSFSNDADRDSFYDTVDEWIVSHGTFRFVLAIFPFIIGMRFFKVFSLQPRLGLVTATIQCAMRDIIHFGVVFASIFLVFVTSSMILFGPDVEEFTNYGRATMSVFRMMLGDFDWDRMVRVGRPQVALWFFIFVWLVNLIMLNMLLAIIMDVYTEVKAHINSDAETMWSQVAEITNRWWEVKKGRQTSMNEIMSALVHHHPDGEEDAEAERLTIASFMALVPSMPQHQATRLLVSCYKMDEEESLEGGSMAETSSRVQHIFKNTVVLHESVEHLTHMNEVMAEMMNANFAEMRYHDHSNKKEMRKLAAQTSR